MRQPLETLGKFRGRCLAETYRAFEVGSFSHYERTAYHIHPVCLSGWGMPLGELFDLEALSAKCKELGRYTFFLSSEVMNVSQGIGDVLISRSPVVLRVRLTRLLYFDRSSHASLSNRSVFGSLVGLFVSQVP